MPLVVLVRPTGDGTQFLRGHPSYVKVQPFADVITKAAPSPEVIVEYWYDHSRCSSKVLILTSTSCSAFYNIYLFIVS